MAVNSGSKENLEIIKNSISDLEKCHNYIKERNIEKSSNLINKTTSSLKA